jgi:hypothetical protein
VDAKYNTLKFLRNILKHFLFLIEQIFLYMPYLYKQVNVYMGYNDHMDYNFHLIELLDIHTKKLNILIQDEYGEQPLLYLFFDKGKTNFGCLS